MFRCRRREIVALDADGGELSEAGVDAVDRLALRDDRLDGRGGGLDGGAAGGIERGGRAEIDAPPVGERRAAPGVRMTVIAPS